MKEEKAKPQIILDLEKALGIEEVNGYELNEEGDVVMLDLANNRLTDISPLSSLVNLNRLDLRFNELTDISPLFGLVNLNYLDLSENKLTDIISLSSLINLNCLHLSKNKLTDISSLSILVNLNKLYLNSNSLINISSLLSLINLKELHLNNNGLIDISSLLSLVNLKGLYLSNNSLNDISSLSILVNLKELYLSNNGLIDISSLSSLVNLKSLYLGENELNNISSLSYLVNLENLYLSDNGLTDISPLYNLVNLKGLDLSNNRLTDISPLYDLVNLKELDLSHNELTNISFLSRLVNLQYLYLSDNGLTDISPLYNLVNLKGLDLSNNRLTNISLLSRLINLNELDLSNNGLTDISSLYNLVNLKELDLRYNHLKDISLLSRLINLNELNLSNNELTDISKDLINNLTNFKVYFIEINLAFSALNFIGNPLPPEMIEAIKSGGRKGLLEYLEAQEKGTVKIEEAKMVLLGEPRAGKTTLQKYLMGLPINEAEASTPDIQISTWRPFETENERGDTKINLWDFGGQEIQYSLHKLFMTTDTLYIIVLDSTKDQSPNKYLAFLENYAPKAPFIIINNYADVATTTHLKIDENYLRETYNGKDDKLPVLKAIFNRVSIVKAAKNDISWRKIMDEVVDTIKTELLSLDNLNKEFPIEYQKVKQAIESEYLKPDKHYITMSYYRELCKSLEVTDTEDRRIAILLFLNQIGVLRYFNDSALTDRHILNPKWLIDGAYSLIIDESTALNHGVLTKRQALSILKRSNNFKFYEEEAEFIFKTMNIYGLLHFEESEQKLYIPIRFGSNQPIALNEFYEEGKHFTFEFKTDIPEDIMPTLIVRHFSDIQNKHYWSKGAVFTKDDIRCLARVEDRTIHFYIIGQFHQSYFYSLRSTLIKNLEKLSGLQYEEWVEFDFNGKKIKAKYIALINFLKKNRNEYIDDANDVEIPKSFIIEILGGYFSQQAINQVTNNIYHGDVTFNDNRYQQISILNQLQSLAEASQDPNDQQELKRLIEEFKAFSKEKTKDKKEGLAKKLFVRIKKIGEEVADDTIKDKLKEVFPTILNYGVNYLKDIDLEKLIKLFEQQM